MHDLEEFWENLEEIPSSTNIQELVIHLAEFLKDLDSPESTDPPSEQNED